MRHNSNADLFQTMQLKKHFWSIMKHHVNNVMMKIICNISNDDDADYVRC